VHWLEKDEATKGNDGCAVKRTLSGNDAASDINLVVDKRLKMLAAGLVLAAMTSLRKMGAPCGSSGVASLCDSGSLTLVVLPLLFPAVNEMSTIYCVCYLNVTHYHACRARPLLIRIVLSRSRKIGKFHAN